ncbi:hypothetical protein [Stenotrophomonas maltophilia]|uniref:hypothetical protein n=1 Tax=Stenotrophomonas maltophilia TaxID=40324 RepID=UPI002E77CD81|nr:hypothetical protein [Stenotrophomonas maltophilia]
MGELNKEAKGTLTAGDLELIREAIEEARAGAARKRKLQLVWIYLTIVVTFTCSAWWTTQQLNETEGRISHVETAIYGDPKSPVNEGLIMRAEQAHVALYGEDGEKNGVVYTVSEID